MMYEFLQKGKGYVNREGSLKTGKKAKINVIFNDLQTNTRNVQKH